MSNHIDNKNYGFNNASNSSKNITQHGKNSHVEDEEMKIIGMRPVISKTFSPIDINEAFPQKKRFSERKTECHCRCHEDSS